MPDDLTRFDAPKPTSRGQEKPPLFFVVGVGLFHFWRWGYMYGSSDQDEVIPQVLRHLDPGLFSTDWYVLSQSDGVTVRTAFVELLHFFGLVFPLPAVVLVLHFAVVLAVVWGVWRLAYLFSPDRLGAALGTFIAIVLVPFWTLGGNGLTSGILVPEYVAWALALPAVWLFVMDRRMAAAILLGLAAWMQLLVGVQTALVLGLLAIWEARRNRSWPATSRAVLFGVVAGVVAAPIALPALLSPPIVGPTVEGVSTFFALAELRIPHHYLVFSFGLREYARFSIIVVSGLTALWALRRSRRGHHTLFAIRFIVVTAFLLAGATLLTEGVPILFVAKLQLFKLTVWVTTLLSLFIGSWIAGLPPTTVREFAERILRRRTTGLMVVGVATGVTIAMVVAGMGPAAARYGPSVFASSDLHDVESWARTHTPRDALFITPPSNTTFRTAAQRSVVVNFKPTPYQRGGINIWLYRILSVAPIAVPEDGAGFLEALDVAYASNDEADWHRIAGEFDAEWALVDVSRTPSPPSGLPAFRAGDWAIYRINE